MNNENNTAAVYETTLAQLGGMRPLVLMLGAHGFAHGDNGHTLTFRIKVRGAKANHVRITLAGDDTYTVKAVRIHGMKITEVATHEGVYAEELVDVCEKSTGLAWRLPRVIGINA